MSLRWKHLAKYFFANDTQRTPNVCAMGAFASFFLNQNRRKEMSKPQPTYGQIETGIEIPKTRNKLNLPIHGMQSGDSVLIEWAGDGDDRHRQQQTLRQALWREKKNLGMGFCLRRIDDDFSRLFCLGRVDGDLRRNEVFSRSVAK